MSADQQWIDDAQLEGGIVCPCGYENFERVIVERVPGRPITTDFLACVGCHAMYFSPVGKPNPPTTPAEPPVKPAPKPAPKQQEYAFPTRQSDYPTGWVDPATTKLERLKADAEEAAKGYHKPGHLGGSGRAAGGSIANAFCRRLRTHGSRVLSRCPDLRPRWLAR